MKLRTVEILDCKKITSIEEIKLILDEMNITILGDCIYYDKLKHLIKDTEKPK